MSNSVKTNVRREDTNNFVASVSRNFDNQEEAVAWSESMAEYAAETNVEGSRSDDSAKDDNVSESNANGYSAASEGQVL